MSEFLDEVLRYVELDDQDQALLRDLHGKLAPHFAAIAVRFYDVIAATPGAMAVLSGPEQIERMHGTLIDWMSTGLLGPYDDRYYEKRMRIGQRHVQIGLPQHYMFTAMNVVRTAYLEQIALAYPPEQAWRVARAANKLLDVELAIMLRHYQLESEVRTVDRERRIQADRLTAMQTLTAGLAHEVRNPLNAAHLQLELLERRLRRDGSDPKLLEPSELANHEIERLTALLDDFLAFARPPELHRSEQDVVALCRHVIDAELPLAQHRRVELSLEGGGPIVAQVDSGKMHQIVQNLVRNALEAAPPGGHVRVRVRNHAANTVHVLVSDDGPGIPAEVLARIYEPFFSTKDTGTGMGMAIVHSLLTAHGGQIAIDTGPRGTTFDIALPQR